jgi:hypothetical protein
MSYPINYPTPQGANIQTFEQGGSIFDWVKPQGASFVFFTLIGSGGAGGTGQPGITSGGGGGSGAVTNFMCPAFLIPDVLRITVGAGGTLGVNGTASTVIYQAKNTTGYTLLSANGGTSASTALFAAGAGGTAMTANGFCATGFFQSIAGQAGTSGVNSPSTASDVTPSATTFLSGGGGGSAASNTAGGSVTPNYGYPLSNNFATGKLNQGYFIKQPILVGCGGSGGYLGTSGVGNVNPAIGGIGCGGGGSFFGGSAAVGGNGFVVIVTW